MRPDRPCNVWASLPGNWDKVNARILFPSSNRYGIPDIAPADCPIPGWLASYKEKRDSWDGGAMHFFLDDYRFESFWNNPERMMSRIGMVSTILAPDFSVYRDWPIAMQMWQVYRSRWLATYWQSEGLQVIPTMQWAGRESHEFCFEGLTQNSMVAISTQSSLTQDADTREYFVAGFRAMCERLHPVTVLCYGALPEWVRFYFGSKMKAEWPDVVEYPKWCRERWGQATGLAPESNQLVMKWATV